MELYFFQELKKKVGIHMKVMVFQIGLHWCLILKLIELKEFIKLKIKVLFLAY